MASTPMRADRIKSLKIIQKRPKKKKRWTKEKIKQIQKPRCPI